MLREVLLLVFVSVSSLTLSTVSRPPLLPKLRLAGCTDTWETTFPEPVPKRATDSGSRRFPAAVLTAVQALGLAHALTRPALALLGLVLFGGALAFALRKVPPGRLRA